MKKILLWDPRFPKRDPIRLNVVDSIASAIVRAGVGTAADPADVGALSAGGALDPSLPTEVVLQHGASNNLTTRVILPYSVVLVGAAAGLLASIGTPLTGMQPQLPTVTLSASISKAEGNSGANLYNYTVTRSATAGAVAVPWSFTPGNTSADDFTGGVYPAGGSVALADGQASGTFSVSVNGDTVVEGDETFNVYISTPNGYVAGASTSATGTILNDDAAAVAAFTMSQLAYANKGYQRDAITGGGQGKGTATIPVPITVTAAGPIYARRRSTDGSNTILQDWWLVTSSAALGAQSLNVASVDAPAFTDPDTPAVAKDGYFFLDLTSDSVDIKLGTVPTRVSDRIAILSSQSLGYRIVKMVTDATTIEATPGYVAAGAGGAGNLTVSNYGRVFVSIDDNFSTDPSAMSWQLPSSSGLYTSAGAAQLIRLMMKQRGVAVDIIGAAHGTTAIDYWSTTPQVVTEGAGFTQLKKVLAACENKWSESITGIGHTDSFNSTPGATFASKWTTSVNYFNALNTVPGGTKATYAFTIPYCLGKYGASYATDAAIRQAGYAAAQANGWKHMGLADIDLADGVHQNQNGAVRTALTIWRASRFLFGLAGDHLGPSISSINRSTTVGGNLTINFAMPTGATALVQGSASQALYANRRFLMTTPGNTNAYLVYERYAYQQTYTLGASTMAYVDPNPEATIEFSINANSASTENLGSTVMIYDNHIEADEAAYGITVGRPVEPSYAPLSVAGVSTNFTYNLIGTGTPSYVAGASGFGTALDVARGTVPFGQSPTRSMVLLMKIPAAPSALEVAASMGTDFIGVNPDGTVRLSTAATVQATVGSSIADNLWHEHELVISAGKWYYYLDGNRIATGSIVVQNAAMATIQARNVNAVAVMAAGHLIDSLAVFGTARNTGATKTVLTVPLTGTETGLRALYNFEGNLADSCVN